MEGVLMQMSDTPETQKVFDWFYSRNADRVSSFIGINRVQARMEDMERERDEIAALVRRLFQLLETVEVSDSEREFYPTRIQSCRVMHTIELGELLPKLKEAAK
jgi:hypothetical protein